MSRLGSLTSGTRVEHRVRLAAEHLDVMAEIDERLGQVPGVDALATDVRLPPVGEIGDAQGFVGAQRPTCPLLGGGIGALYRSP